MCSNGRPLSVQRSVTASTDPLPHGIVEKEKQIEHPKPPFEPPSLKRQRKEDSGETDKVDDLGRQPKSKIVHTYGRVLTTPTLPESEEEDGSSDDD